MKERKPSETNNVEKVEKLYVIFKRCNRASGFIHLPHIDQRLQYTSFTEGKGLKVKVGEIINTPKNNQLLIVHTSNCDPSEIFDIEKSSFDVQWVIGRDDDILNHLDKVKVPQRVIAGNKCYVINKRKFTYVDIKDAVRVLNCIETLEKQISVDEQDGSVYMPTYFYNLLGSLKAELFDELVEN